VIARHLRTVALVALAGTASCLGAVAGGAAGAGLGYAAASDGHKGAGVAIGALVGLAVGGIVNGLACTQLPSGPFTPGGSWPSKAWYCP